jgi:alkyl hydroperoxide reductase subunit AhpC
MKSTTFAFISLLSLFAPAAAFAVAVGQPAPDFTLPDVKDKAQKLSDYAGKYVVLEWVNPDCPFVRKHYNSGNMPGLQSEAGAKDVVWLTINSTHPGHSEYKTPAVMQSWLASKHARPLAMLFDRDGSIGKEYGARTTPHMYVIDPKGKLVYMGAIDDKRSANPEDVKTAKNYVRVALDETMAGRPVTMASTVPYGCSIKYAN